MNITINAISPTQAVVQVEGRLDAETADSFKVKTKEVAGSGVKYVTVDDKVLTKFDTVDEATKSLVS
ncbi:MAG: anti-sigma factor antagonist [Chloroflexi bacterium]|nr:anti-sigma factor antagonist [Chloroflexota bacterium]